MAFYLNESRLRKKKILIIDRDAKTANDHTWCFWEKGESAFEEIIFNRWKTMWFHGTHGFSKLLDLGEYRYKMIRAADFYQFILQKINENPHFVFLQTEIESIDNEIVTTAAGKFSAKEFVFDSFTRKKYDNPKYQNLFQHFQGWLIESEEDIFNVNEPTLFDFRVEQKNECRFIYILPLDEKKALIEFTVFSDNILEQNEYDLYLRKYVSETLKIKNYKIKEKEKGIIPMSDEPHQEFPANQIIRIGTSGGYVKPSTGYSFYRTQKRLQELVGNLENSGEFEEIKTKKQKWKYYLDSVLLDVLAKKKHAAADVFTRLFERNDASEVLKFLDEDSSFSEDLKIMRTVPILPFTKSAVKIALKKN